MLKTPITGQILFTDPNVTPLTGTPLNEVLFDKPKYFRDRNVLSCEYSDRTWFKRTYDDSGHMISNEYSDGSWAKYAYNDRNQEVLLETALFWEKRSYSDEGWLKSIEFSDGRTQNFIAHDGVYGLQFHEGRYQAGCRDFSYEEAIEHWIKRLASKNELVQVRNRAKMFLSAIEEHQATL